MNPFEEPFNVHVELEEGGDVNIVRFGDGQIRLSYESDSVRVSFPVTAVDLRKIRLGAADVVLADHLARSVS